MTSAAGRARRRGGRPAASVLVGVCLVACGPATPAEVAAGADLVAEGALTACVAETPRLVERTEDGGWEGFDVAVLEGVAATLELDLVLVEVAFDDIVSGTAVNDGRCDIGAAGVVDADELDVLVTPTAAYREVDRLVLAPVGTDAAVSGLTVGIEDGGPASDARAALEDRGVGAVEGAPSLPDLLRIAAAGRVDAVLVPADQAPAVAGALGPVSVVARVATGDRTVMVLPRGVGDEFRAVVDAALTDVVQGPRGRSATARWLDP